MIKMNENGTITVINPIEIDMEDLIDRILTSIDDFFDDLDDVSLDAEDATELVKIAFNKILKERM